MKINVRTLGNFSEVEMFQPIKGKRDSQPRQRSKANKPQRGGKMYA